ncbi:hypothetical protein GIB67_017175 [Kingdonia uniflora]|uniref:RCHY1 zinc-ribbon domain-containing protein n=1 Tax=Kingdonia uniflora TaxID=39325 RepID=A0A7J7NKY9_9MAGN|nr:hypothetical protein GIB67_017175 [Kingdonia uniflora]
MLLIFQVICSLCSTEQDIDNFLLSLFRLDRVASTVVFAWGSTFVKNASSSTTMSQRINTTAMGVEYAELEAWRTSSIVINAYLFDSTKEICVLHCGHTIHLDCLKEMELHFHFACPVCSKSVCDMSNIWKKLDQEIASAPMSATYRNKMVWILCNDCGSTSEIQYHFVAHKCISCKSYNTRQIQGSPASCSSII